MPKAPAQVTLPLTIEVVEQPHAGEHDTLMGLSHLINALAAFKRAGAVNTIEKVKLAISSAKGAARHARTRDAHPDMIRRKAKGTAAR